MRAYFQLFFGLLIPLSAIFMIAAVIYFRIEYDLIKAFRLGILAGFFIGVAVSLFTALFLLIMRRGKKPQKNILVRRKKVKVTTQQPASSTTVSHSHAPNNDESIEHKAILLMDKELAFEVLLYTINHQHIGIISQNQDSEEILHIKTKNEIINLSIHKLTRHTSQLIISADKDSKNVKKIMTYMKTKELSFSQY